MGYFVLRQVHQSEFKMAFIKVALFLALVAVTTAYTFKKTDQKPGDLNAYHCTANRLDKLHRAPDNTRIIFTGPKKVLKGSIKEKDCKDWCEKHLVQGFKCVAFSYQAYDRQGGSRCEVYNLNPFADTRIKIDEPGAYSEAKLCVRNYLTHRK